MGWFRFGSSNTSTIVDCVDDGGYGDYAPALSVASWEDMCHKGGGTAIVALVFLVSLVGTQYWMYQTGVQNMIANGDGADPRRMIFRVRPTSSAIGRSIERSLEWIEHVLVEPFVPIRLDSFVMYIFLWFFVLTIPMVATRHYEMRWAHDTIALQGPFNIIAYIIFGCKSLSLQAIPYSEVVEFIPPRFPPPPVHEKWSRMDFFLTYHLTFGCLWLVIGFVQIYQARDDGWSPDRKTNWRAHRIYGYVSIFFLSLHILMMAAITRENPVNQHPLIRFAYWAMIYNASSCLFKGLKHARARHIEEHKMYMFYTYVRSTMGSGNIRFSAWLLWLVGHFMPPEIRIIFDRGDCQTHAEQGIGDATDCWKPVYINLLFTDLLAVWLELLYLKMRDNYDKLAVERKKKQSQLETAFIVLIPSLFLVMTDHIVDTPLAEFSSVIWFSIMHFDSIVDKVHDLRPAIDGTYSFVQSLLMTLFRVRPDE